MMVGVAWTANHVAGHVCVSIVVAQLLQGRDGDGAGWAGPLSAEAAFRSGWPPLVAALSATTSSLSLGLWWRCKRMSHGGRMHAKSLRVACLAMMLAVLVAAASTTIGVVVGATSSQASFTVIMAGLVWGASLPIALSKTVRPHMALAMSLASLAGMILSPVAALGLNRLTDFSFPLCSAVSATLCATLVLTYQYIRARPVGSSRAPEADAAGLAVPSATSFARSASIGTLFASAGFTLSLVTIHILTGIQDEYESNDLVTFLALLLCGGSFATLWSVINLSTSLAHGGGLIYLVLLLPAFRFDSVDSLPAVAIFVVGCTTVLSAAALPTACRKHSLVHRPVTADGVNMCTSERSDRALKDPPMDVESAHVQHAGLKSGSVMLGSSDDDDGPSCEPEYAWLPRGNSRPISTHRSDGSNRSTDTTPVITMSYYSDGVPKDKSGFPNSDEALCAGGGELGSGILASTGWWVGVLVAMLWMLSAQQGGFGSGLDQIMTGLSSAALLGLGSLLTLYLESGKCCAACGKMETAEGGITPIQSRRLGVGSRQYGTVFDPDMTVRSFHSEVSVCTAITEVRESDLSGLSTSEDDDDDHGHPWRNSKGDCLTDPDFLASVTLDMNDNKRQLLKDLEEARTKMQRARDMESGRTESSASTLNRSQHSSQASQSSGLSGSGTKHSSNDPQA